MRGKMSQAIGAIIAIGAVLAGIGALLIVYSSVIVSLGGQSVNMTGVYFGVALLIAGCATVAFCMLLSRDGN